MSHLFKSISLVLVCFSFFSCTVYNSDSRQRSVVENVKHEAQIPGRPFSNFVMACGEMSPYRAPQVMYLIVIGSSGGRNCVIQVNQKKLDASDFRAGYVCVGVGEAKYSEFIKESDPRALSEVGYEKYLQITKSEAAKQGIPIEIIYVVTSTGPVHREVGCNDVM